MTSQHPSPSRLTALVDEIVAAYNAKDFDRLAGHLDPNLVFCHHNRGFAHTSRDEFIATLRQFATEIMPDRRFGAATRVVAAGNTVIREQTWSGHARFDIPGMARAGELLQLDLCSVYVFNGELVSEYHDYG